MTYSLDRRIDRIDRDSALYPQPESSDIAQQVQELASQIEENRRAAQNAEAIAHSAQEKANAACRNEHIYC
ncbi:hypothetical protein [Novosphingobium sp.]|uniref:hypothetical protein n=1 Tax=Novosphingobium sp. TaxID=1874826 RepID=UPI00286E9CC3|nr:hypothetical protein [Novosphingobium sp.]